jgi:hypothetical protein
MQRRWGGHRVCCDGTISAMEKSYANPALMEDRDR